MSRQSFSLPSLLRILPLVESNPASSFPCSCQTATNWILNLFLPTPRHQGWNRIHISEQWWVNVILEIQFPWSSKTNMYIVHIVHHCTSTWNPSAAIFSVSQPAVRAVKPRRPQRCPTGTHPASSFQDLPSTGETTQCLGSSRTAGAMQYRYYESTNCRTPWQ